MGPHALLVLALRLHLAEGSRASVGWLFALADKQMGAAINAMHSDPAHRRTLQSLAERLHVTIDLCAEVQGNGW